MELRYAGEDKLFVPVERLDLVQKYTGASRPALDRLGGTTWEKAKTRVKKADARHGGGAAQALRLPQGHPRPRLQPRQPLAAGVRGRVRVGPDDRSAERRHRHQARHGVADADGPPAVRRRRLRQDRSRDARGLQGRDGRQAGGGPGADDRARVPAPEDPEGSLRRVSGPDRHGQPVPHQGRAEGDARGPRGGEGRDHRRHAPPALEGRDVPRPRPARRRRRAALRRRAQGTHQADEEARRRPDDDGDADSADAEHVARRHPRHVDHRDAAQGSPLDPDQRGQVRPGSDAARDRQRARARRPGVLRPQPRRVDLLDGGSAAPARAAGAESASATAR